MLSIEEISCHCPSRTFHRGAQIAASGRNLLTKQCRYNEFETTLSAFVASSNGWSDRYRTSVSIDEDRDEITDYTCTCPAYLKYDGMCKHAVALAIAYSEDPSSFFGYKSSRTPETSPSIAELMRRIERTSAESEGALIRIEPTICYGYENWSAHFRIIGSKGSYVMKSIGDFVEHMRCGDHVSYGKKLAFTHSPGMLTEASRKIARFLERAVSQRSHDAAAYWRPQSSSNAGRVLHLTNAEAIELLDLMGSDPFTLEGSDSGIRATSQVHIIEDDPFIALRITKAKDGYLIMRDERLVFAADGERMYVLQDDVLYKCSPQFARNADFFRDVYCSNDDRLFIAEEDMPLFCATMLPELEKGLSVSAPEGIERYRPVECELEFYFDKTDKLIELRAQARYGTTTALLSIPPSYIPAPGEGDGPSSRRNEQLETKAKAVIRDHFYENSCISLQDDEAVARLLFGGIARFQALGSVFTTPAFDRLLSDRKPRVSIGLSIVGNLINLDVSSDDVTTEELAAMLGSYRKRKRFHKLKGGAYLNLEDMDLEQLSTLASDLDLSLKAIANGHIELPTYKAFYLDQELGDARRSDSFTCYIRKFQTIDQSAYEAPEHLSRTLRPYQIEGFRWLSALTDMGFGGILADEMGLGKSIQLISLLADRAEEAREFGPSLIVCPASLVYNWLAEFERFAPELTVRAVVGTKRERALVRQERNCDVFVTSYDLLRIDAKSFEEGSYWCHVLDEAQYIKNHATLTTRAVKRIRSRHRFALTGTPMENRLSELWSIFDFLMPGLLGSYARFRERYEISIIGNDEDAARRLQALVGPFILRRLKEDVLPDLPEKIESVVYVPMKGEQLRLYSAHEQKLRTELALQKKEAKRRGRAAAADFNKVEVLAELMRLRQICCDPSLLYENYKGDAAKLGAIVELVEQSRDNGKKVLVFSQFTSFLSLIADKLDEIDMPYYTITGATPKKQRLDLVNAFNVDDTPAFLVSLKAGGTGLNLIGAQVVVHADPWWNAAAQNQATDRAHRIGQANTVQVYRVIAKGTIEERILHLQEAKSELAEQIIGSAGSVSLASLTRDDLIDLLEA